MLKNIHGIEKFKRYFWAFLIGIIAVLSIISYGQAKDYYFWRDDTFVVWAGRYQPHVLEKDQTVRNRFIGSALNIWFYTKVIGFDSTNWQYTGLILKILDSIAIFFLIKTITRSTSLGFMGAAFYASFLGGLEAYTWARLIAFEMIFIMLTFTCYIKSYLNNSKKLFILALLLSCFTLSLELWRTFAILLIIPFWEICQVWSKKPVHKLKSSLIRITLFLLINIFFVNFVLGQTGNSGSKTGLISSYSNILTSTVKAGNLKYFEISLGNLVRSPLIPVNEEAGLSGGDLYSQAIGIGFIVITILLLLYFIKSHKTELVLPLVFSVWTILFYFPNWLYESPLTIGATHRYLAISALGVSILTIWVVSKIKMPYQIIIYLLLVGIAINNSIGVVNAEYQIRGKTIVNPIMDKLIHSIPPGEKNSVLNVWGDNKLRGYVFDWSGPFTYTYLRGIASYKDFPIFVNYIQGASLLCDPETLITNWENGGIMRAGEVSSLDKFHGFFIDSDGILEDKTDEFKLEAAKNASCLTKKQMVLTSPGLYIQSTTYIKNLNGKAGGTIGLITNWRRTNIDKNNIYTFVFFLTDKATGRTYEIKSGVVQFDNNSDKSQTETVFSELPAGEDNKDKILEVESCSEYCNFAKTSERITALSL